MPGDDIELRAFACHILSRCIVASSEGKCEDITFIRIDEKLTLYVASSADILREAIPYLLTSEKDYSTLQMLSCQQDVLYFLATVYNTMGMLEERDTAAARHAESVAEANIWIEEELPEDIKEIWSIVGEVGSIIAANVGRFRE